jgi:hypothetical protein
LGRQAEFRLFSVDGRTTKFWMDEENRGNGVAMYMYMHILAGMNTTPQTPAEILRQIALIDRMEPGKVCFMREGPNGPYFNLQYREDGKARSVYVPRDQVETVRENTENYAKFQALADQYAGQVVAATRAERTEAKKKRPATSATRRKTNSRG